MKEGVFLIEKILIFFPPGKNHPSLRDVKLLLNQPFRFSTHPVYATQLKFRLSATQVHSLTIKLMTMKLVSLTAMALACILFVSCDKDKDHDDDPAVVELVSDFNNGTEGWQALFSDYPVGEEVFYELDFKRENLPAPLDQSKKGIKVAGNNHSDDLLTVVFKKVSGLNPNTTYGITITADIVSNACKGCPGIGGSPDLALGGGAIPFEPANKKVSNSGKEYYRPNFTSDLQSHRSNDTLKVLGNIGTGTSANPPFAHLSLNNNSQELQMKTNGDGELWLLLGTDSGFEGLTTLYYTKITTRLVKK